MALSQQEIDSIREESKKEYPHISDINKPGEFDDHNRQMNAFRLVYIAALTAERERTKVLVEKASNILLLCEADGTPVDGFRFREMILELKEALSSLNSKLKP